MPNISVINRLQTILTGALYDAQVTAINADATTWAGVTIAAFAESYDYKPDNTIHHPALICPLNSWELLQSETGQCEDLAYSFSVTVEAQDITPSALRKKLDAHEWAVRHVILNSMRDGDTIYLARVLGSTREAASPLPNGPLVASLTLDVEVKVRETWSAIT